jgi:hypothetical protein
MKKSDHRILSCLTLAFFPLAGTTMLKGASITAQWNFDDVGTVGGSVSNVGGFTGSFTGVAGRSATGDGVSGSAGDYSMDVRQLGNSAAGSMTSNTPAFLSALNAATSSQAISISFWEFLDSTPNSTAFWGTSPSAVGIGGQRGLNAHTPWSDGNLYFDTAGCCDGSDRIFGPMGAAIGEWQHVTLVYNNGVREAWRNSTMVATGGGGIPLAADFNAFIIGNDNTSTNLGMDARLDNFTIWSGALTPAEIATLSIRPTVPEPATWVLGTLGALAVTSRRVRRRSA